MCISIEGLFKLPKNKNMRDAFAFRLLYFKINEHLDNWSFELMNLRTSGPLTLTPIAERLAVELSLHVVKT